MKFEISRTSAYTTQELPCEDVTKEYTIEAAEYCHWLNGGASYKYDNIRTEN